MFTLYSHSSEQQKNEPGIVGTIAQLNIWLEEKPPPLLMAMFRGINGIGSYHISWEHIANRALYGNIEKASDSWYYLPGMLTKELKIYQCP